MTDSNGSTPPSSTPGQPSGSQPTGSYQQPPQHQPYAGTGPVAVEQKTHGFRTFIIAFIGALVACLVALGGFGLYNMMTGSSGSSGSTVIGSSGSGSVNATEEDLTLPEAVAQKALPSVVAIDVYTSQSSSMYGYMYGGNSSSSTLTQSSLGSGVVLTSDGYIVTNYHVIEGADALKVTIGGEQYDAEVVGSDASSDLAVIKASNASDLTAIEIGTSEDLIIGEWVMTIGSPFGLEQSVATGIVSATSRSQIMSGSTDAYGNSTGETTIYPNMIQTDAAINPGNSGGALVDSEGKLIGINTLITSYSGNYSGVGFAIPVDYAVNIAQQIIDGKTPTHAQLGVSLSTVSDQTAERYGLAVTSGAYITRVYSGSGAAEAGLEVGDIVTKFDGQAVSSASDLTLDVRSKNPGDKVTLEINRNGETRQVEVTLGSDDTSSTSQNSSSALESLFGGGQSGSQS